MARAEVIPPLLVALIPNQAEARRPVIKWITKDTTARINRM
jgi:hypothetical protein